jgi:hypothetical protein
MAFDAGDTVVLRSRYFGDDGSPANPSIPIEVSVRRVGDSERHEFQAEKKSKGVFEVEFEDTDTPGTYYYRFKTSDGDVTQQKFKVEPDHTKAQ